MLDSQHLEQSLFCPIKAWYSETGDGSKYIVARVIRHPKIEVRSITAVIGEQRCMLLPDFNSLLWDQGVLLYQTCLPSTCYKTPESICVRTTSDTVIVPVEGRRSDRRVSGAESWLAVLNKNKVNPTRRGSYGGYQALFWKSVTDYLKKKSYTIAILLKEGPRDGFFNTLISLSKKVFVESIWVRWVCYVLKQIPRVYIINNPERIGHLASEVDILVAEVRKGLQPGGRYFFVVRDKSFVENVGIVPISESLRSSYLLKMIKRKHFVVKLRHNDAYRLQRRLWNWSLRLRPHICRDIHGVLDEMPPMLSFTRNEIQQGWKELRTLGLTPDTPFVCLHLREAQFVDRLYQNQRVPRNRYAYRDVDPESYQLAIRYLLDQGIRVVRMGVPPVPKLSISEEGYIDYANTAQSSFLDIFLAAHCLFFLGTTSGLYALADLFRRPILTTNFAPLRHVHSWSARFLVLPQTAYSELYDHTLTIEEMLLRGIGDIIHGEKVEHLKIKYIANTKEEILDATQEMLGRLRGSWRETLQDWDRQERFWSVVAHDEYNRVIRARISAGFLKKYDHLLPPVKTLPDRMYQSP